ncbi:phage tail protein [Paraburkholderia bengalensis]|uniref:Phage tail protein n=1 Tax=Paraburkholderia bengalensis TaxID=2747562 RepID=A0ABU8J040_9BURK
MPNSAGVEVARISVKVSPNTKEFRRELKTDLEKIERELSADVPVNADLNAAQAKADFKRLMMQLKTEAARGVNIPVDVNVDKDTKGGFLSRLLGGKKGLSSLGDDAAKASSQVQHLDKSFLGLTRTAWIGVGIVAIAAPLVGLVAGLLAGLPSLLSAFGAGAGVVALGMDGIKAAAETMMPALEAAKTTVSSTFQTGLTPVFQQLGGLLTTLTPNLQNVATGIVNIAKGFTDVVSQGPGLQQLQNILDRTGEFFTGLGPVISTGTQAFLTLSNAGANAFGHLLAPLQEFANGFNDMVNRVTSNGVFDGAMQGLSQTLGSILNLFNRLMESGLQAMGQLGGPLSTLVNGIGDLFIALMPALTSVSSLLGNVLGTLGTQLAPIITALTPAFTTLADTLGTMLTGALQALGPVLTVVAETLGTALTTALQAIQPMLPTLVDSFKQLSETLVTSLGPYLPQIGEAFGQIVGAVIQLAPTIISSLIPAFQTLIPAIAQLAPSLVQIVQAFTKLMPVIVPVVQIVINLAAAVVQAGASIASFLIGGISRLVGVLADCVGAVAEWVGSWSSGVQQVSDFVGQLPGKIKSWFDDAGSWLIEAGKNVVQGLINGIGSMISSAVSKAKELASSVKNAVTGFLGIHSPSRVFAEIGQFTAEGFGNGFEEGFQPVIEKAKALAAELSQAMESGVDPSGILAGISTKELKQYSAALEQERKRIQVEKNAIPKEDKAGRAALQAQLDQIKAQKDILAYQRDRIKNEEDYVGAAGDDPLVKAASGLMNAPVDFAKATGKQFLTDLGISGDGAISKAITEGIQYIFQIGSVDEALSIKDREESKNALSVVGRA